MKRLFVAGAMGLALAGCAHFRGDDPKGPNPASPVGRVGMEPVPSIHDTINRGTGNAALAQSALGNPNDPRWSGKAPSPDAARLEASSSAAPPPQMAAIDPNATGAPVPITAAQPPQTAARGTDAIRPSWSSSPPDAKAPGPDATRPEASSLAEQPPQTVAIDPTATDAPVPITAAQPPKAAARGGVSIQPRWSNSPPNSAVEAPDRLAGQPNEARDPGGPSDGLPDRLNPTASLDAAAAAAAVGMPAGSPPGANPPSLGAQPAPDITSPPPTTAGATATMPQTHPQAGADEASPASAVPYSLERAGGPMPAMATQPVGSRGPSPTTPAAEPADAAGRGGALPAAAPEANAIGPKVAGLAPNGLEPVGEPPASPAAAPTDAAVSPSAGPQGQARGAGAKKPKPAGDPLLGPNPDLMPELPPLPDNIPAMPPAQAKPSALAPAQAQPPATPSAGAPAVPVDDLPPLEAGAGPPGPSPAPAPSGATAAPAPAASPETPPAAAPSAPPELGPPTGDNRPAGFVPMDGATQVADLPPLAPVPSAGPSPESPVQQTVASSASPMPTRRHATRRDGRIQRVSLQKPASEAQDPEIPASWRQASLIAAKIGDEIITMSDLRASLSEHCRRLRIPYNELPPGEKNTLGSMLLKRMIDESLLIQEAKRTIKNPKMYDQFTQEADRFWHEDVIPQLQVQFQSEGETQLREKLKENGRSFDTISQATRRSWMAENFLHAKLKDKIKVDLPDLLKYYEAHKHDKEFDRSAEIAWREIVVETGRYPTREDARRKIEALHQSLRQGADFAALARAQSEGPSRSREQGGLMQTSPGSYGVPAVNEALQSLSTGQVSGVLEGPSSFHIVRVEGRRAAGPAPFEELQDQIRNTLQDKRYQTERAAYIRKLWDETFVSTFFDDTDSDPRRFTN